jgi:hypothetical protein
MQIPEQVIRAKVAAGEIDFTVHAIFEAAEDLIFVDEIEAALLAAEIIEHHDDRRRCFVRGSTASVGLLHAVIEYSDWQGDPTCNLVVVTVYRPDPALWIDGRTRRI